MCLDPDVTLRSGQLMQVSVVYEFHYHNTGGNTQTRFNLLLDKVIQLSHSTVWCTTSRKCSSVLNNRPRLWISSTHPYWSWVSHMITCPQHYSVIHQSSWTSLQSCPRSKNGPGECLALNHRFVCTCYHLRKDTLVTSRAITNHEILAQVINMLLWMAVGQKRKKQVLLIFGHCAKTLCAAVACFAFCI